MSTPSLPHDASINIPELYLMLGRMESKIDLSLSHQVQHQEELQQLTKRVSTLEQYKARLLGVTAVISSLVGIVGAILASAFRSHYT